MDMSDYIEISTTQLNSDREFIEENIENIQAELESFSEELYNLNGMWTGPSNAAYIQQISKDLERLQEVLNVLSNLVQCMSFAAQEYVKCEDGVADLVASIRI